MKKTKALVLFSGGLDSRLAVKLLQDQKNLDVSAVFFKLPFGGGCCNNQSCVVNFAQLQETQLYIIDLTKGKNFEEYLEIVKKPKHGTGTSINPCKDCKIFMLQKAKELADEIGAEIVATGEVLGQRPMSQLKQALLLSETKSNLKGRLLRPLSAKLLPETDAEKKGIVNRKLLLGIQGRQRKIQMKLAEKYKIKYPESGGGCILCEKQYTPKLVDLFKNQKTKIKPEHIQLLKIGRHFRNKKTNSKIILGRNENENTLLGQLNKTLNYNILIPPKIPGPTAIYENKEDKKLTEDLIKAYEKDAKPALKDKFIKLKI
ncbi:hypothetical protein HOD75_00920 [archaeon]|jgi:tRNA-uridine 2-sulfurtransferase|nr:hypothetical protein [archaeon]MBT4241439.1 hypothetical protein [archaeon]MBT4417690.1 hypothetical protein [archaeon]